MYFERTQGPVVNIAWCILLYCWLYIHNLVYIVLVLYKILRMDRLVYFVLQKIVGCIGRISDLRTNVRTQERDIMNLCQTSNFATVCYTCASHVSS